MECVEISSDESNHSTIITNNKNNVPEPKPNFYDLSSFEDNNSDDENKDEPPTSNEDASFILEDLCSKYLSSTSSVNNHQLKNQPSTFLVQSPINGENSSDFITKDYFNHEDINEIEKRQLKTSFDSTKPSTSTNSNYNTNDNMGKRLLEPLHVSDDEDEIPKKKTNTKKGSSTSEDKILKKQLVEQERMAKRLEKEKKKEAAEKEKALKKAIAKISKSTKPDECLKNIIVILDKTISYEDYGDSLKMFLNESSISHETSDKEITIQGLISWKRIVHILENMSLKETIVNEKYYLLILRSKEFSKLISTKQLLNYVTSVLNKLDCKHLTILVYGIESSNEEQEFGILEVDMFYKCYWQFAKDAQKLNEIIKMVTKAVAQIPHKMEVKEKLKLQNEYFNDSNKDTVKVDKNGNGLSRLWHQMLTMFPMARLETAEAITAVYPTPTALFKAYEEYDGNNEEMLQNLPIRRSHGPLTSARKLGPEFSKKVSNFFNSVENVFL